MIKPSWALEKYIFWQTITWFWVQFGINKHEYIFQRLTKCGVFEKFTSAHLFQIAQEKSCDYLLITYTNEKISRCLSSRNAHDLYQYHEIRKNYAINCAIQGMRLISKQKIWLAICEFLWSLTNQNAWFCFLFLHCFKKKLHCS